MMTTTRIVRARAFAKINLALRVGALRDDGYHPVETVFQSLALHDSVACVVTRGPFVVTCDDAGVPTDDRNLVWKAARALWQHLGRTGEPSRCTVSIAKHIPMAAGLGGGSADAAAAIVGLHALWKGRLSLRELGAVAARVGADVPYFLVGGTALGLGRGDDVYPLADVVRRWVVLACPGFGVSTADAYRWFDEDRMAGARREDGRLPILSAWAGWSLAVRNDLQGPVARRHAGIGRLVGVLRRTGAEAAAMTGSGSAVFGLYAAEGDARRAAHAAAAAGAQAILTRSVSRAWCRGALGTRDLDA